jgi:hypothetical protein
MSTAKAAFFIASSVIACGACSIGSEDSQSPSQKSSQFEARQSEQPVIRATKLSLVSPTVVADISGVVYITRAGKAIKNPQPGEPIQIGDMLQITEDSSITLSRNGTDKISLTRQHGEWFVFE